MDFEALWKDHWKLIVGGGVAVAVLAMVMMKRTSSPSTSTTVPMDSGGGDNGQTAAAISDLGAAMGAQSDSFAGALAQMQQGQQAYFASIADMINSQDHAAASEPMGSNTTVSYFMPPAPAAPAADAPQAPLGTSLDTIANTYGNNAIYQGAAEDAHAAKDAERLKSDPAFRQSEIQRALHVIDFRKGKNLDTSEQEGYLKSLLGA